MDRGQQYARIYRDPLFRMSCNSVTSEALKNLPKNSSGRGKNRLGILSSILVVVKRVSGVQAGTQALDPINACCSYRHASGS